MCARTLAATLLTAVVVGLASPSAQRVDLTPTVVQPATGRGLFRQYCAPCHGRTGEGNGMVVQRGFKQAASYHIDRLRQAPPGYFFDVITNGFGAMPDYQAQIPVNDRWAIVAYLKALQLSMYAPLDAVPAADRGKLDENRTAAAETRTAAEPERH